MIYVNHCAKFAARENWSNLADQTAPAACRASATLSLAGRVRQRKAFAGRKVSQA
jgi:hypothetical protein